MGKTKLFMNCLPAPQKTEKQTQGSNQRLIVSLNPSNVPVSNTVKSHSTHVSGPPGNTLQIAEFYTLILLTLMDELQPQLGMSN